MVPTAFMAFTRAIWSNMLSPPTVDTTMSISCSFSIFSIASCSFINPWKSQRTTRIITHTYSGKHLLLLDIDYQSQREREREMYVYDDGAFVLEGLEDLGLRRTPGAWTCENIGGSMGIQACCGHELTNETGCSGNEDTTLGRRNRRNSHSDDASSLLFFLLYVVFYSKYTAHGVMDHEMVSQEIWY